VKEELEKNVTQLNAKLSNKDVGLMHKKNEIDLLNTQLSQIKVENKIEICQKNEVN